MASSLLTMDQLDSSTEFSLQDLGVMMTQLCEVVDAQNMVLMAANFDLKYMMRQQEAMNCHLQTLTGGSASPLQLTSLTTPRQPPTGTTSTRTWKPPPSHTTNTVTLASDFTPRIRIEAPRFNGDDPLVRHRFASELTAEIVDDEDQLGGYPSSEDDANDVVIHNDGEVDVDAHKADPLFVDVPSDVVAHGSDVRISADAHKDTIYEVLQQCEFYSHEVGGNDAPLSVEPAQSIKDLQYAATPTLSYSDDMKSCLNQETLLSVGKKDLFRLKQALASDARAIPPRKDVTRLGRSFSMGWRPPPSRTANSFSSIESLPQFVWLPLDPREMNPYLQVLAF